MKNSYTYRPVPDLDRTALVVVDVQRAFDDAGYWGRRNNPDCEANVASLIGAWRKAARPLVFVRHEFESHDHAFKDVVTGEPDLLGEQAGQLGVLWRAGLLDAWLRAEGIGSIALCGITTDHCVETTARMGAQPRLRRAVRARRNAHVRPRRAGRDGDDRGRARPGDGDEPP